MNKQNTSPLISIIVPIYNSEKWLKRCLDSIIAQTYKNLQIILVNDGSIDSSEKICTSYSDSRIEYVRISHSGVSAARNEGLNKVRGEFISFVDSDDYLSPLFIEILYQDITEFDAEVVCCKFRRITDEEFEGKKIKESEMPNNRSECVKNVITGQGTIAICRNTNNSYGTEIWNKLYRVAALNLGNFDCDFSFGEDTKWLWPILMQCKKVVLNNQSLYTHIISSSPKEYNSYNNYMKFYKWELSFFHDTFMEESLIQEDERKVLESELLFLFNQYSQCSNEARKSIRQLIIGNRNKYTTALKSISFWGRMKLYICMFFVIACVPVRLFRCVFNLHN